MKGAVVGKTKKSGGDSITSNTTITINTTTTTQPIVLMYLLVQFILVLVQVASSSRQPTPALVSTAGNRLTSTGPQSVGQHQPDTQQISWIDNSSSLLYTRRRFDEHFLPLWRSYMPVTYKALETPRWDPEAKKIDTSQNVTYYLNKQVILGDITEEELILEAIDQDYKSRLIEPYSHRFDNPADRARAENPEKISETKCKVELDYLLDKLSVMEEARREGRFASGMSPELATFFDSFGAQESGVLLGNSFWVGQWRQCSFRQIAVPLYNGTAGDNPDALMTFSGRYCVAKVSLPSWSKIIDRKIDELKKINYFRHEQQPLHYRRYFTLEIGSCIPESCDSMIVHRRHEDVKRLVLHKMETSLRNRYQLDDLYCLPDSGSDLRKLDVSGIVLVSLAIIWFVVLTTATLEHWTLGRETPPLVLAMSLIESWRTYFRVGSQTPRVSPDQANKSSQVQNGNFTSQTSTTESGQSQQTTTSSTNKETNGTARLSTRDIGYVNGIKVLFMLTILIGHCALVVQQMCKAPLNFSAIKPMYFHLVTGAAFWVDWYFGISGFVCAYATLVTIKGSLAAQGVGFWLYTVFHRYWRLAPIYLLLFWYARSVFHLTGEGPVWDYGTSDSSMRAVCRRESWLTPLTLTSNFKPLHQECIMPAWFLSADMQYYIITPPLLMILQKSSIAGWLLGLASIVGCLAIRVHRYLYDPHVRPLDLIRPSYDLSMRNNWDLHQTYLFPQYRVGPYLMGVLAGWFLYKTRSQKYKPKEWSQLKYRVKLAGWIGLCTSLFMNLATWLMWTVIPDWLFMEGAGDEARVVAAVIYGSHHLVAGIACSLVLVALGLGTWTSTQNWLAAPIFTRLSRLNFFVYLGQMELLYWLQGNQDWMPEFNSMEMLRLFLLAMILIWPLSLLVQVFIANPMSKLEIELIGSKLMANHTGQRAGLRLASRPESPNKSRKEL